MACRLQGRSSGPCDMNQAYVLQSWPLSHPLGPLNRSPQPSGHIQGPSPPTRSTPHLHSPSCSRGLLSIPPQLWWPGPGLCGATRTPSFLLLCLALRAREHDRLQSRGLAGSGLIFRPRSTQSASPGQLRINPRVDTDPRVCEPLRQHPQKAEDRLHWKAPWSRERPT